MSETVVGSGQTSSGLVVTSGNTVVVSGGTLVASTVDSGGLENVSSGGTVTGTNDLGDLSIGSGGIISASTVEADAVLIGGGGIATGTVVKSAGLIQLGGTGVNDGAVVSTGGVAWVYASATISGATLSGGKEILGGTTSSTQFGVQATSGGTALNTVVDTGGAEYVGTDATATGTTVNSGGTQQIGGSTTWTYHYNDPAGLTMSTNLSGGVASNVTVNSGGDQLISSGGTAIGTTVFGEEQVVLGGVASATTIEAGGVVLGGSSTVIDTVVLSRGLEQLGLATVDSGTTVSAGGTQWLYNGANAHNATLNGGIQVIGGVTSSPQFNASTTTGGTATGTVVNSGAAEYVGTDATAVDTLVTSGGTQQVGGSVEWSYFYQVSSGAAGATLSTNLSGGIVSGTILSAGTPHGSGPQTVQTVGSGGTAIGTVLESFAVQEVDAGGVASGTTVDFGNVAVANTGGSEVGAVVNSGGLEQVGGGTVSATTVNGGGIEVTYSGGEALGTTLSGGVQIVGGTQSSTLFGSGGLLSGTASGTVVDAGGTQYVGSGATVTDTTVGSGGTQQIGGTTTYAYDYAPGTTVSVNLGPGVASGTVVSDGGTEIVSSGGTASGTTVSSGGLVEVFSGGAIAGTHLISGGAIDLEYATYSGGATATLNSSTDVLTVTNGADTYTLQMSGAYAGDTFVVSNASDGSVLITENVLCYLRGTRILTSTGETPIEDIRIGDQLVTRFGAIQKVKWIGRQSYDLRFIRENKDKLPVRFRAGALGPKLPARDLLVSPGHSLFLGDRLVLAKSLVNGITITQVVTEATPNVIEYFQVELESHDCIVAEGTWSESYADAPGMRAQFHNHAEYRALYPDAPEPTELKLCAPRPERGPALDEVARPLAARAAKGLTPGMLDGYIDKVTATEIHGWAKDLAYPELPVLLEVLAGDEVLGTILACDPRGDLRTAGKGNCAFSLTLVAPLPEEAFAALRIRRAVDGAELMMTPSCRAELGLPAYGLLSNAA